MSIQISEKQQGNDAIVGCAYVFPGEIASETRVSDAKIAITLEPGKAWKPIYFTPGSAALTTEESVAFSGRITVNKFEMKIPGGSADLIAELNGICGRPIVLKLTFESGNVLICGGKTRKLRLVTSTKLNNQNGSEVSFEYKCKMGFKWL